MSILLPALLLVVGTLLWFGGMMWLITTFPIASMVLGALVVLSFLDAIVSVK